MLCWSSPVHRPPAIVDRSKWHFSVKDPPQPWRESPSAVAETPLPTASRPPTIAAQRSWLASNAQADPTQFDSLVCREWWQAHRAVTGSDEGFLNDIAYAWHQTDEALAAIGGEEDPRVGELFGRLLRYTLVTTSLRSLSAIPTELLVHLVTSNPRRWTIGWAMEQALRHPDPRARAETLGTLTPQLPEDRRAEAMAEALSAAQAIGAESLRAHVLASAAAYTSELPANSRRTRAREILRLTASGSRTDVWANWEGLLQSVLSPEGATASSAAGSAILDVTNWFDRERRG